MVDYDGCYDTGSSPAENILNDLIGELLTDGEGHTPTPRERKDVPSEDPYCGLCGQEWPCLAAVHAYIANLASARLRKL